MPPPPVQVSPSAGTNGPLTPPYGQPFVTAPPSYTTSVPAYQPTASVQKTNGLAIASMVLGIVWIGGLGSLLAVILGLGSKRQIRRSNGSETGGGFATAGITLGIVGVLGAAILYASILSAANQFNNQIKAATQANLPAAVNATPQPKPAGPAPAAAARQTIQVASVGFTQELPDSIGHSYVSYGAVLTNPNSTTWSATDVNVNLSFTNAAGTVVKAASETVAVILPGQSVAIGDSTEAAGATRVQVQTNVGSWQKLSQPAGSFSASGISTSYDSFAMKTTGTLHSTFAKDMKTVQAVAIYYNTAGKVVGGAFTYVDFVPAGGTIGVEIHGTEKVAAARTEIYAVPSFLSIFGS
jgi:hypothetical protein